MLLTPFRDGDVVARWSELPFALASFVAVAAIARRLGLAPRSAALAAVLYAALPRVAALAFAAGNDHVTAFGTLAALDAALACAERPRAGRCAYLGVALGLLAASKYLGLYGVLTILAVGVVALVLRHGGGGVHRRSPAAIGLAGVAIVVGAAAIAGGYSYLRNWVTTGNPVYPQPIHLLGLELPGREEMSLGGRRAAETTELDLRQLFTSGDNPFAGYFPFTMLPAALLAPLLAAARRRWSTALVCALPAVLFLEFLYGTWDHRDIRYFLAGVALAAVAFAWLSERLRALGSGLRALVGAVLVVRLVRWLAPRGAREMVGALLVVALAELARRAWSGELGTRLRSASGQRWVAVAALALLVVVLPLALGGGMERYQRVKLAGSPAAVALERLVGKRGAVVAYVGLNEPYLFFGNRLQNELHVVPRSRILATEYYTWGRLPERPYRGHYRGWLESVHQLGVRYVVVVRTPYDKPERAWMARRWHDFHRVYDDGQVELWSVVSPPARLLASPAEARPGSQRGGPRGRTRRPAPVAAPSPS